MQIGFLLIITTEKKNVATPASVGERKLLLACPILAPSVHNKA